MAPRACRPNRDRRDLLWAAAAVRAADSGSDEPDAFRVDTGVDRAKDDSGAGCGRGGAGVGGDGRNRALGDESLGVGKGCGEEAG